MENIYVDLNVIDEKTTEKAKSEQLKEQKDVQETTKLSESAAANKIGDKCKLERIYIIESAKRKEKIAEITPGWCE
ncbi:6734_t:CDS:2 [Racocetra fulgida]|uniref:6734_t:CDS:1 n=1 Tax=Racocetra fulgida TaxID=60492 RepID=A0A9N9DX98_9GLOM|nr:6734_t:CDS:2 [Racocetra fulgida]